VGIAGKAVPSGGRSCCLGGVFAQRNYRTTHGISAARSNDPFAAARDVTKPTVLRRRQGCFGDPHLQRMAAVRAAAADIAAGIATLKQARIRQPTALGSVS
jgi:hypothetical protein